MTYASVASGAPKHQKTATIKRLVVPEHTLVIEHVEEPILYQNSPLLKRKLTRLVKFVFLILLNVLSAGTGQN